MPQKGKLTILSVVLQLIVTITDSLNEVSTFMPFVFNNSHEDNYDNVVYTGITSFFQLFTKGQLIK